MCELENHSSTFASFTIAMHSLSSWQQEDIPSLKLSRLVILLLLPVSVAMETVSERVLRVGGGEREEPKSEDICVVMETAK